MDCSITESCEETCDDGWETKHKFTRISKSKTTTRSSTSCRTSTSTRSCDEYCDDDPTDDCSQDRVVWCQDFVTDYDLSCFQTHHSKDGTLHKTARGLLINSMTFKSCTASGLKGSYDHIKWLAYHNDRFLSIADETVFEGVISACQVFNRDRPIPKEFICNVRNIHEDYRLCTSSMHVYDPETKISFHFLLTNDAIYAMYERQYTPSVSPATSRYQNVYETDKEASFACAVYLQRRGYGPTNGQNSKADLLEDCYRLAIGIDRASGVVRWYINRREVFAVNRIGYRLHEEYIVLDHGGVGRVFPIDSFNIGFGHYTFLDHQMPNNYAREKVVVDTETDKRNRIPRSTSGLVMLSPEEFYREPYADIYGVRQHIKPCLSFAVVEDCKDAKIFGQGMVTLIKSLCVYHRRRSVQPIIIPIREICDYKSREYDCEDDEDIDAIILPAAPITCTTEDDEGFRTVDEAADKKGMKHFDKKDYDCNNPDDLLRTMMGDTDLTSITAPVGRKTEDTSCSADSKIFDDSDCSEAPEAMIGHFEKTE